MRVRDSIVDYLRGEREQERSDALLEMTSQEGAQADLVAQLLAKIKPPLDRPEPHSSIEGYFETSVEGPAGEIPYYVQTPLEYDPHVAYPTVVMLPLPTRASKRPSPGGAARRTNLVSELGKRGVAAGSWSSWIGRRPANPATTEAAVNMPRCYSHCATRCGDFTSTAIGSFWRVIRPAATLLGTSPCHTPTCGPAWSLIRRRARRSSHTIE